MALGIRERIDLGERKASLPQMRSHTVRSIAQKLRERIENIEYPPDHRLPAERQLAHQFSTSRWAIREALDVLVDEGLVVRRAGSGSFVREHKPAKRPRFAENIGQTDWLGVVESTGPLELQIVRGLIEPDMVRLAVLNMSMGEIANLGTILLEMEAIVTDAEAFIRAEERFLQQIARSTDNALLISVYDLVASVRRQSTWNASRLATLSPIRIREQQKRYRSMFDAIKRRDVETAAEFAKLQLIDEQRFSMRSD